MEGRNTDGAPLITTALENSNEESACPTGSLPSNPQRTRHNRPSPRGQLWIRFYSDCHKMLPHTVKRSPTRGVVACLSEAETCLCFEAYVLRCACPKII